MIISGIFFKVEEIMDKDFIKVEADEKIKDVLSKMIKHYKDEVLVVDEEDKLTGIFTRSDLAKLKRIDCFSLEETIEGHVKRGIITIGPNYSARDARDLMLKNKIGRVPVVKEGKIAGILTSNNIRDTFYLKVDEMFDLLNNIINHLHEAVCICDNKGIVTYWNKSAEILYDVKSEDIIGTYIGRHFPNAAIIKVLKEGKAINNMKHEPVKGKSVILSAVPIYNADNETIAIVSTDRDITEVVTLSKQLESTKEKMQFLEDEYKRQIAGNYNFSSIVGRSKSIIDAVALAQKVSQTSASVLITGESGTGKEVFAKAIHEASGRVGPFVEVNCSAIPEHLLESELFGYVEGAFTGAIRKGKIGKFEFANNGTLFLDEIGDMPIEMQAKLLRVLQDGVVYRLGSEKGISTDTRIIAATNKNLKDMIVEKKYRGDLFYRLAVVQLELPPLRERKEDIKDLINIFINQTQMKENINIDYIDERVYDVLVNYKWEGNIRELKNVVQRMIILSSGGSITLDSIPEYIIDNDILNVNNSTDKFDLQRIVGDVEKKTINEAMKLSLGNKQKAAELLNIKRTTLYYKLNQYGL